MTGLLAVDNPEETRVDCIHEPMTTFVTMLAPSVHIAYVFVGSIVTATLDEEYPSDTTSTGVPDVDILYSSVVKALAPMK